MAELRETPTPAPATGGPETLLGHLAATRAEVFTQAEVMCTISLGWVLSRSAAARRAFGLLVGVGGELAWWPEDRSSGVTGRPDLVGRVDSGSGPRVIVEAKLGAPLDEEQLRGYMHDGSTLVVLVPHARVSSVRRSLDRWGVDAPVVSWDHVLSNIERAVTAEPASAADLAQLADLYRHVERSWIAPFSREELRDPLGRIEDLMKLVDQSAGVLTARYGFKSFPLHHRPHVEARRYVTVDEIGTTPALGVFLSVADQLGSPLGLMIHRATTPRAHELAVRWTDAQLPVVRHDGHTYLPLHVPTGVAQGEMVDDCVEQAHNFIRVLVDPPVPLKET